MRSDERPFGAVHLQWFGGEDDTLLADDDLLTDDGGAPESNDQPAAPPAEEVFAIRGEDGKEQQVPFGKLSPKQVREWFEAHRNSSEWRAKNTQEAQRIAEERKAHEAERTQYQQQLEQLERWTGFFRSNEPLQKLVAAYIQGKIPQQALAQILGEQAPAQGQAQAAAGGEHPAVTALMSRLSTLERSWQEDRLARERERVEGERKKAIEAALSQVPAEQQDAFRAYMEEKTKNMSDLSSLYGLVANAYMWDKNRDSVAKQAQQQTLENIQKKAATKVDTGKGSPAVNLPNNVDAKNLSIGQLYEQFGTQVGAYE